jgi:hypothetical protein
VKADPATSAVMAERGALQVAMLAAMSQSVPDEHHAARKERGRTASHVQDLVHDSDRLRLASQMECSRKTIDTP